MLNRVTSNLLNIIITFMLCKSIVSPICAANSQRQSNMKTNLSSDDIPKTMPNEFSSENILRNSLNTDKNITLFKHPLPHYKTAKAFDTPSWQLSESLLKEHKDADTNGSRRHNRLSVLDENVKIHNDFHYGINKSNQENNSYNNKRQQQQQTTSLLSNIKIVNSSTLSPLPVLHETTTNFSATAAASSSSSSYFERVEMQESLAHTKNEKLLLHRNKRYLLFPEGSSFQLVFDLIIPIVDYTNFAIMGITCAVAWELPSKPPSEIIENFQTKLNDGTFGLSRRNDSTQENLEYINSQRTEPKTVVDKTRWGQDATVITGTSNIYNQNYAQYQQQNQQMSATVATTSGYGNILTNALKQPLSPTSSNFYYNRNSYNRHSQQQQQQQLWQNYNLETFDSYHRKNIYDNNNNRDRPMYRNEFNSPTSKNNYNYYQAQHKQHPTNNWNTVNWQIKQKNYPSQPHQTKIPYSNAGDYWNKDNWWERNKNRIEKHWQENQQKWSQYQENPQNYQTPMFSRRTGRNRKILNKPPKHRIYPIFGKRRRRRSSTDQRTNSFNDDLAKKLQDIHTREHLHTRHKLYGKIEKLYKTRGQNGTACVLRALCETEKMHLNAHYNETPQSFVMELLRSIFALPKDTLTSSKDLSLHLDDRYTAAVLLAHDDTQSCSQQYHDCEYSITYDI